MINILLRNDDEYILDTIGLPPINYDGPEYNIRALDKYCKENNIQHSHFTSFRNIIDILKEGTKV